MKLLLDTHTFLWFINDDNKLSKKAKEFISDPINTRYLSYASLWEIAIKQSIGKIELPDDFENFITEQLKINFIDILPFSIAHFAKVKELPYFHKDPFDRIIIAQSMIENIRVVGVDPYFAKYGIKRIW